MAVGTAVLMATGRTSAGGPAAALSYEATTLLGRLLDQLSDLGLRRVHLITRDEWEPVLAPLLDHHPGARLHTSPDLAGDLSAVAELARAETGSFVLANADILTQREALAGLLADPRVTTGMLTTTVRRIHRYVGLRTQSRRGRVVSAASPYHEVAHPNGTFLDVLKVAPADRAAVADVAERLSELVDGQLPAGWREELSAKAGRWKLALHRRAQRAEVDPDEEPSDEALDCTDDSDTAPEAVVLGPVEAAELERRVAAAAINVPALVLCGLVRSNVRVGGTHLRRLFWTRPLSPEHVETARARIGEYDEDKALLNSAVKASDGFFTTHFVSPYSKYIARWAARRGWSPNLVSVLSMLVGILAAAGFATGQRWGMIAGALLLQWAFTLDCVDGQLARYTRTFTKFGAWLDSILDRSKEYAVFVGLALGAARTGDDVWLLAGAALTLQVVRHCIDFSYPQAEHQAMGELRHAPLEQVVDDPSHAARTKTAQAATATPTPPPQAAPPRPTLRGRVRRALRAVDRSRRGRPIKKIIAFPIGERFAAISIVAALTDARTVFIVLLAWGLIALTYTLVGRVLRSLNRRGAVVLDHAAIAAAGVLDTYRDDGPVALAIGRLNPLRPPAAPLVLSATALLAAAIAIAGTSSPTVAAIVLAIAIVLAGLTAGQPLRDRLRWTVPPALRALEYAGILWVAALAGATSIPAAIALLLAITYRHYDIVYRLRHRAEVPPRWLNRGSAGWDGRLIIAAALAAAGAVPLGYYIAAGALALVFIVETVLAWRAFGRVGESAGSYDDDEEDE